MYYIVNKVIIDYLNQAKEHRIETECLNIFKKNHEALSYINDIKHINIYNEDIILTNVIKKEPICTKDVDGYHLVVDTKNKLKFNIYLKKSYELKGYIYNTVDIQINYVGYIEIITYKPNIKLLDIKNNIIRKKTRKFPEKYINKIDEIDEIDEINEIKEINSKIKLNDIHNISKDTLELPFKKQKRNNPVNNNVNKLVDEKHLYIELNDKLIQELKIKLDRLAMKKNI
jgi:hypothetical protein